MAANFVTMQALLAEMMEMTTLVIRDLKPERTARLRQRAVANGRSMEAEARAALQEAVGRVRPRKGSAPLSVRCSSLPVELTCPFRNAGRLLSHRHQHERLRDPPQRAVSSPHATSPSQWRQQAGEFIVAMGAGIFIPSWDHIPCLHEKFQRLPAGKHYGHATRSATTHPDRRP